jgi:RHS repeat-associated protein
LHDGQGSVRGLVDSTGASIDKYTFNAYGEQTASSGTTENSYRYTGQQFDALTGLYSLRARYYSPGLGRFLSRDTMEFGLSDPTENNRYNYARSNPISYSDPSGHFVKAQTALVIKTVVGIIGLIGLGVTLYRVFCNLITDLTGDADVDCGDYQLGQGFPPGTSPPGSPGGSPSPGTGGGNGNGNGNQPPAPPSDEPCWEDLVMNPDGTFTAYPQIEASNWVDAENKLADCFGVKKNTRPIEPGIKPDIYIPSRNYIADSKFNTPGVSSVSRGDVSKYVEWARANGYKLDIFTRVGVHVEKEALNLLKSVGGTIYYLFK